MSAVEALPIVGAEDFGLQEIVEPGIIVADEPEVEVLTRRWQAGPYFDPTTTRTMHFVSFMVENADGEMVRTEREVDEFTQHRIQHTVGAATTNWVVDFSKIY